MTAPRAKTRLEVTESAISPAAKTPRTERGRRTMRALLDAATAEFGEKGFHDSSVVSITSRAGVALGSFYTYFDSKEALYRALVRDLSDKVRENVAPAVLASGLGSLATEGAATEAFLQFAAREKDLYRIIDEAEFVANEEWREHYVAGAARILDRLRLAETEGDTGVSVDEVHAWALMGMNVFLGLRFGVMGADRDLSEVAGIANALLRDGLGRKPGNPDAG